MNIDKKFENRQKKMIQDGRGQGRGKDYVPCIFVSHMDITFLLYSVTNP